METPEFIQLWRRTEAQPEPEPLKKAVRHLGVGVTQAGSKLTVKWSKHPKRHQPGDDHAPEFHCASSDKGVAKVNKKGKITAKGPGKCTVYVIARNGLQRRVRVTVKQ